MRWPSAYCATSSGIAILSRRVRTQPDCPSGARTRLQSSIAAGGPGFGGSGASSSCVSLFESSSQFAGGGGGTGMGGGGYCGALPFLVALVFFTGGGTRGLRGRAVRGRVLWVSTSTLSFSLSVD